jgi:hypothetical protein
MLLLTLAALTAGATVAAVLRRRRALRRPADDGTRAASLPAVNDALDR